MSPPTFASAVPGPEDTHVTVVIPVYNDEQAVRACLQSLAAQTWPLERTQVLVVDNDSAPPLTDLRDAHPRAQVIRESRRGSYAARNAAIRQATGTVFAFTDADCRPAPDWIANGVQALATHPQAAYVAGRVELYAQDPKHPTGAELYELAYAFPQEMYVRDRHFGVTANLFVRRDVFERVGPFDERLTSGGDQEWGKRAHDLGLHGIYASQVVVRHPARRRLRDLYAKRRRTAAGSFRLARNRGEPVPDPRKAFWWFWVPALREVAAARKKLGRLSGLAALRLLVAIHFTRMATFLEVSRLLSEERAAR